MEKNEIPRRKQKQQPAIRGISSLLRTHLKRINRRKEEVVPKWNLEFREHFLKSASRDPAPSLHFGPCIRLYKHFAWATDGVRAVTVPCNGMHPKSAPELPGLSLAAILEGHHLQTIYLPHGHSNSPVHLEPPALV